MWKQNGCHVVALCHALAGQLQISNNKFVPPMQRRFWGQECQIWDFVNFDRKYLRNGIVTAKKLEIFQKREFSDGEN